MDFSGKKPEPVFVDVKWKASSVFFQNWKNHNLIILYVKKKLFLIIILHENHDLFIISSKKIIIWFFLQNNQIMVPEKLWFLKTRIFS